MKRKHSNNFIAQNIQHLRELGGYSKEQLAEFVGLSGAVIGSLERGATDNPSYYTLEAVAVFFGVDVTALVRSDLRIIDPTEYRISRYLRLLDDADSAYLESVLLLMETDILTKAKEGRFRRIRQKRTQ